jgi:hypothetical protein
VLNQSAFGTTAAPTAVIVGAAPMTKSSKALWQRLTQTTSHLAALKVVNISLKHTSFCIKELSSKRGQNYRHGLPIVYK